MSDSCNCMDIEVEVMMEEPETNAELDFSGEVIFASDGEDYKRGYEEGHARGLIDGRADGYQSGYDEGHKVGSESGYSQGKQDGLTEGYNNGYAQGKADGYTDGYNEGYSKGYEQGIKDGTKEEQEKSVTITKNGTTEISPDENKVLSKVTVDVDVKGEEFIGIKILKISDENPYQLPEIVDIRSLSAQSATKNENWASDMFSNVNTVANGGLYVMLREVYLPDTILFLSPSMFSFCGHLTTLHGDLSKCKGVGYSAFDNCKELSQFPDMPSLEKLAGYAFNKCTGLTSINFYKVLTTWTASAFQGCTNITEINLVDGWNTAVYAQHCINLSQVCLHDMCEKLADMTGQDPLVFKVGETNIAKIDDEHIAMLQQKNIDYS